MKIVYWSVALLTLAVFCVSVGTFVAAAFGVIPTEVAISKAMGPLAVSLLITMGSLAGLPHFH